MKSILIIDPDSGFGGSSKSIFLGTKYINKKNIKISVWLKNNSPYIKEYKDLNIYTKLIPQLPRLRTTGSNLKDTYIIIKAILNFLYYFKLYFQLFKTVKKYDVIHINNDSIIVFLLFLKNIKNKKIITHVRTVFKKSLIYKIQVKLINHFSNKIIFISEEEYNKFQINTIKSIILSNPIENCLDEKSKLKLFNLNKDKLILTNIGNFNFKKGQDFLIEIAEELIRRDMKNFLFLIAGKTNISKSDIKRLKYNSSYNRFEDLIELNNLSKYFYFLGYTADLSKVYNITDIYIKPSREKMPWGRDLLEAMAHGIPYISVGCSKFIDEDNSGFLIEDLSSKDITDKILLLYNDKDLRIKFGLSAKKYINTHYNPYTYAEKLKKIWIN